METDKANKSKDNLKKFDKNPYDPENVQAVDVVRIFYANDVSLVPVISNRGILLGFLKKDEVISEMSDIDRVEKQKTDKFINSLLRKMTFDEILPYLEDNLEFITINLFGEIQSKWSRLELLTAVEQVKSKKTSSKEVENQREEKILEWVIYLILEHIPRALYAVNEKGNTIFYNSYFEELYETVFGKELDIKFVENTLKDSEKNEIFYTSEKEKEVYFYNKDLRFYYEKVPFTSNNKTVGYLIFQGSGLNKESDLILPGIDKSSLTLDQTLGSVERMILVDSIKRNNFKLDAVVKELKISRQSLTRKIKKYDIELGSK